MKAITFESSDAYLVDDLPNFAFPYDVTATLQSHVDLGLTGVEERTPLSESLLISVECTITLETIAAVSAFRNALQAISTHRILLPLWVAKRRPSASHRVGADWWAVYQAGQDVEVYETAAIPGGLPSTAWLVPVMVGTFDEVGEIQSGTSELGAVTVRFRENHASSISITDQAWPTGLDVGGEPKTLFPFRPNNSTVPTGASAKVSIERTAVGQSRVTADTFYSQPAWRTEDRFYTLDSDDPWGLLRYYLDMRGTTGVFWLPSANAEARLTADLSPSSASIPVDDVESRGENTAMLLDDGSSRKPVEVIGNSGSEWDLADYVGQEFLAIDTQILGLIPARFLSPSIALRFDHDTLASAQVRFREASRDVDLPVGEVLGTTAGALDASAYLYTIAIGTPGSPTVYRLTGYQSDLAYGEDTWTARHIEHSDIQEVLGLDRQSVRIKTRIYPGSPFLLLLPNSLEYPMMVEIAEVDVFGSTASDPKILFYGEISKSSTTGPMVTAIAESAGAVLDRKIPRRLIQPACNFSLFDVGCGVDRADWKYDALSVSWNPLTSTLVISSIEKAAAPQSGLAAHKFSGGYVEVGAGENIQTRWVADNAAQSGTTMSLTLATPLTGTPSAGTLVALYPGCDGSIQTCVGVFNNRSRFGGFPFMPIGNPSLIRVSRNVSAGGKK